MYKALHVPSEQEIISLDPRWRPQVAYLRALDQRDALVCPGCEQPVRLRAGKTRRWHFAHKHLQNCPFDKESSALLQARALLYSWLIERFPVEAVTLERKLDLASGRRYVDGWVTQGDQIFAYWIFDRRMPPDERSNLKAAFHEIGAQVNWIFLSGLLRVEALHIPTRVYLTTTERAFMQPTQWDQAWQTHFDQLGRSLHYLDTDQETLITYRNLNVIHPPQLYAGTRLTHPLTKVLADTDNGEFIHPGETERLQKRRNEIKAQADAAAQRLQRAQDFFRQGRSINISAPNPKKKPDNQPFERLGTCRICGKETADWITYFGQSKECICRECQDRVQDRD